jgi:hypothetical protein
MDRADGSRRGGGSWLIPIAAAAGLAAAAGCRHDWSLGGITDDGNAGPEDVDVPDAPDAEADGDGDAPDAEPEAEAEAPAEADADADDFEEADTPPEDAGEEAEVDEPEGADDAGEADDGPGDEDEAAPEAGPDDADTPPEAEAGPVCGNEVVEPPEQCDRSPGRDCAIGMCLGTQSCTDECTWGACGFGTPPDGDACVDPLPRIADSPGLQTFRGRTCAATDDGRATTCPRGSAAPDVAYAYTATRRRRIVVDTVGSNFDALVDLRTGVSCPGAGLACDDDSAGGDPPQGVVDRVVDAGVYWIVVDGARSTDRGSYVLNVAISEVVEPPANDACASAALLAFDLTGGWSTTTGTTTGATDDLPNCYGGGGPDVWYRFAVEEPTIVYFDTLDLESWRSILDLRSGSCDAPSWTLACAKANCRTARSQFAARVDPGSYFLVVDGTTAADAGAFTLRYRALDGPCTDADLIYADGVFSGDTTGNADRVTLPCVADTTLGAPDNLYFVPVCPHRTITASTCHATTTFDTALGLAEGSCTAPPVACNDNLPAGMLCTVGVGPETSQIVTTIEDPGLYFLVVDGVSEPTGTGPAMGRYGLSVSGL